MTGPLIHLSNTQFLCFFHCVSLCQPYYYFFFIFVNIHVSSYYMYILYHAKQQMVSQILYLFFKYNSLKIFIAMKFNVEKKGKQNIPELCKLRLIKLSVTLYIVSSCRSEVPIISTCQLFLITLQQTHSVVQQLCESVN